MQEQRTGTFAKLLRFFLRSDAGVVAMIFALALPMIVGAAGMAVDLAKAYDVKNRLGNALDKAALAGGAANTADDAIALATAFFNANVADDELATYAQLNVDTSEWPEMLAVSASADVPTSFMSAFGKDYMQVNASSKVKHELAGVEAVLVLDVTGSMDQSLGSVTKITALKRAVSGLSPYTNPDSFINIVFDKIQDTQYIKIGIVPFSTTVNVGSYGLGQDPFGNPVGVPFVDRPTVDNSEGAGYAAYVTPASNINYTAPPTSTTNWWGCIRERAEPYDTSDSATPNWGMYRYPKICNKQTCLSQSCNYWGCTCTSWGPPCTQWSNNDPNAACPKSAILPLTNSKANLQNAVNGLITGGNTYGNVGMAWGWHVITPNAPYTEGVSLGDKRWTKTVIFMSDGDNTVNPTYSAYGPNSPLTSTQQDSKFVDVCNKMKQDGITIYTIAFGSASSISTSTKNMFKACASDPDKYFSSTTGTDLGDAFKKIAEQLTQLHIVE